MSVVSIMLTLLLTVLEHETSNKIRINLNAVKA